MGVRSRRKGMAIIKCHSLEKMGYGQELAAKTETLANVFLKTIIVPGTS